MSQISNRKLIRKLLMKLENIPRNTSRLILIDRILRIPGIEKYSGLLKLIEQDRTDTVSTINNDHYKRELQEEKSFLEKLNNYVVNDMKI